VRRYAQQTELRFGVRAFALVKVGDREAVDLFLREEDAPRALAECRMSLIGQSSRAERLRSFFLRGARISRARSGIGVASGA